MSTEVKNVKYSFYWGHSSFNLMLQITAGSLGNLSVSTYPHKLEIQLHAPKKRYLDIQHTRTVRRHM